MASDSVIPDHLRIVSDFPDLQHSFDEISLDFIPVPSVPNPSLSSVTVSGDSGGEEGDVAIAGDEDTVQPDLILPDNQCTCPKQCNRKFTNKSMDNYKSKINKLSRPEKDLIIMAQLSAMGINQDDSESSDPEPAGQKKKKLCYVFQNTEVCRIFYLNINQMSEKYFRTIKQHLIAHGLTPRVHGNTKRTPHNALSADDHERVVQFLANYADR